MEYLSDEEAIQTFFSKYNKRRERYCIKCFKLFESEGYHNRKCPVCRHHEEYLVRMNILKEPIVYRTHSSGVLSTNYHAEIGE